jgi:hypothetical protein
MNRHIYISNKERVSKKVDHPEGLSQKHDIDFADSVWLCLFMGDNEKVQHPSCSLASDWVLLIKSPVCYFLSMLFLFVIAYHIV